MVSSWRCVHNSNNNNESLILREWENLFGKEETSNWVLSMALGFILYWSLDIVLRLLSSPLRQSRRSCTLSFCIGSKREELVVVHHVDLYILVLKPFSDRNLLRWTFRRRLFIILFGTRTYSVCSLLLILLLSRYRLLTSLSADLTEVLFYSGIVCRPLIPRVSFILSHISIHSYTCPVPYLVLLDSMKRKRGREGRRKERGRSKRVTRGKRGKIRISR